MTECCTCLLIKHKITAARCSACLTRLSHVWCCTRGQRICTCHNEEVALLFPHVLSLSLSHIYTHIRFRINKHTSFLQWQKNSHSRTLTRIETKTNTYLLHLDLFCMFCSRIISQIRKCETCHSFWRYSVISNEKAADNVH